jgi:hypothetical protein
MNIAAQIKSAKPPRQPAPPPPTNQLIQDCEHAIRTAVAGNVEGAMCDRTVIALSRLFAEAPPSFGRLRKSLMNADTAITGPMIDRMVRDCLPATESEFDEPQQGMVEQIIEHVQSLGQLFCSQDDEPFICLLRDGHHESWSLSSNVFRQSVAYEFYTAHGRSPKSAQMADATTTLAGIAMHEGEKHEVHLRVAVDPSGGYLLDMGDDDWRVIRCTANGWQVLNDSPVKFRRNKGMGALPEPSKSGTRDDYLALVNVSEADELLSITSTIECLRPDTAYLINEWCGEQGSGKSKSVANLRNLIDPHDVPLRTLPRSLQDLYVAANNNHMMAFDNLSLLTGDFQDAFCTISTGGGSAGRTLFTDNDETVFNIKRPVHVTGITTLFTRPDALDRVVRIECPVLDKKKRLSDSELASVLAERGPKALGYILDTFCSALATLPSVKLEDGPRMLDFARLGEAIAINQGNNPGYFTMLYRQALHATAIESLDSMPVIGAMIDYLDKHTEISGTVGSLFRTIKEHTADQTGFPKSDKGFGATLRRAIPPLRMAGIQVKFPPRESKGVAVSVRRVCSSRDSIEGPKPSALSTQRALKGVSSARDAHEIGPAKTSEKKQNSQLPPPGNPQVATGEGFI